MEKKNEDYLSFAHDKSILKIIQLETLLFSDQIIKINENGYPQDRNIIITNLAIYNLKDKILKRQILLSNVIGITISNISDEFVIHGRDQEYDYHYISEKRKKIIEAIYSSNKQNSYSELLLFCQVDDYSLTPHVTTRKDKKRSGNFTRMPLDVNNKKSIKDYVNESSSSGQMTMIPSISNDDKEDFQDEKDYDVSLNDFKLIKLIKRGHYSKVVLAQCLLDKQYYAIKVFRKDKVIESDTIDNIDLEKRILMTIKHPFICPIKMVFQTEARVYFAMPFIQGGELYSYMKQHRTLTEDKAKFYSAQIALAFQALHDLNIIYRDLKPENVLIDVDGYLKLIDCGFCKQVQGDEKAMSFVGTPEFLAPEIISGEGHNKACDWWSFGILIYQMLFGIPPFYSRNIEQMYELIKGCELKFPKKVVISANAKAVITKLLNKHPAKRLGLVNGIDDIKAEPFFADVDFEKLKRKQIIPFYKPNVKHGCDTSMFDNTNTALDNDNDDEEYVDSDIEHKIKLKIRMNEEQFDCIKKKSVIIQKNDS